MTRLVVPPTRRTVIQGLGLGLAVAVGSCGSRAAKPIPTKVELLAADTINPNELGEPSPTVIRVFELKETAEFNQAQLFELLDNPQKVIGANFIGFQEVVIQPGQSKSLEKEISGEARFLGVAAGFRDIESADWRKTYELNPKKNNQIQINVTAVAITVEEIKHRRLGIF